MVMSDEKIKQMESQEGISGTLVERLLFRTGWPGKASLVKRLRSGQLILSRLLNEVRR